MVIIKIEIVDAVKKYGEKTVLNKFSLKFPQSGTVCLFGPSGCGKTTLLKCIAGLEKLDSGTITGASGRRISFLFQEDRLLPWSTAKENVSVVLSGGENESEAEKWLELVGLKDAMDIYPPQMSGGMRQRVAAARALAYQGEIFLLDEPFQKLDRQNKLNLIKLFKECAEKKLTVLVTHDMYEAKELADIIYILNGPPVKITDIITSER